MSNNKITKFKKKLAAKNNALYKKTIEADRYKIRNLHLENKVKQLEIENKKLYSILENYKNWIKRISKTNNRWY